MIYLLMYYSYICYTTQTIHICTYLSLRLNIGARRSLRAARPRSSEGAPMKTPRPCILGDPGSRRSALRRPSEITHRDYTVQCKDYTRNFSERQREDTVAYVINGHQ